jgi:DNA-binding NarL/FixJ family response regulator
MRIQKVVMVGFSERTKLIFAPLVKQLYRVESFVCCRTIDELAEHTDMVDSLFMSASYLGFECESIIARIRTMRPRVQIVVLAMHSMSNYIGMYLIRSGVDILFANVDDSNEFMKLQDAVENNLKYYPPNVREAFNDSNLNSIERRIRMPARETECLNLTMKGLSVKEIAEEMNISIGSVGNLRKRTMQRIGAHSFIEMVHLAFIYTFSTKGGCEYVV